MNRNRFSKGIVALIVALNVLFAAAVLIVFWHTGNEPAALIGAWFAFTTGELWLLSGIKKSKIKKEEQDA
jgi:flagellar basal body-associated protein FliL